MCGVVDRARTGAGAAARVHSAGSTDTAAAPTGAAEAFLTEGHVRALAVLLVIAAFGAGAVTGANLWSLRAVETHTDPVAYTSGLPGWICHYHGR